MSYSADALTTIAKLKRKLKDFGSRYGEESLWGFICDARDQVHIRTGVEAAYTNDGFASTLTANTMELYAQVAAILMDADAFEVSEQGVSSTKVGVLRNKEQAIDSVMKYHINQVLVVDSDRSF